MKIAFRVTCFFMAISLAMLMFLGWTNGGLNLLVQTVSRVSGGLVTVESVRGTLLNSWRLHNVSVTTPTLQVTAGELSSSWNPADLLSGKFQIFSLSGQDIDILFHEQEKSGAKSRVIDLPQLALPFSFQLDSLKFENLRLLFADASEITVFKQIAFGLAGSQQTFDLHDFSVVSEGYSAELQGKVDTEKDWYVELSGDVEYKEYGVGPFAGNISLKGPLHRLVTVVDVHRPARGHIEGLIFDLPHGFRYTADLELTDVQLADGHAVLPELFFSVKGKAEGDIRNYGGTLTGRLDYLFFEDVEVEIELQGDYDQIAFARIKAENTQGKALLTDGLLAWKNGLRWHGTMKVEDFDPAQVMPAYPGALNTTLVSSGSYAGLLTVDADFSSLSGMLNGYPVEGGVKLRVADHTVFLEDTLLKSGNAILNIEAQATMARGLDKWRESLVWKAALSLADFNPGLLFDGYQGALNTNVTFEGSVVGTDIQGWADIGSLRGSVRDYPVSGRGIVRIDEDKVLTVDNILLQSGDSTMQAVGQIGENVELEVHVNSKNLGEFLPGAKGDLKIAGTAKGSRDEPLLEGSLQARELVYEKISMKSLDAVVSAGITNDSSVSATIRGEGLRVGTWLVDGLDLTLSGLLADHTFSAGIQEAEGTIDFSGKGALDESYFWSGRLGEVNVSHLRYGEWLQDNVATVAASAEKIDIQQLCLQYQDENVCISAEWQYGDKQWSSDFSWKQLKLSRLNDLLYVPEPLWGKSNAVLAISGNTSRLEQAVGYVELVDAGVGRMEEQSEWKKLHLDSGLLNIKLAAGALNSELTAHFTDGSILEMTAETPWAGSFERDPATLPLRGKIYANILDLGFVAPLSYYTVHPSGSLQGTLDISGTMSAPVVAGNLLLADGRIDMPDWGISLTDASFELKGSGDTLAVQGTASSGAGWLRAGGKLFFDDKGVAGDFRFVGENFDTVMLPEYVVRTSPDVHFSFNRDGGVLTGSLAVPHAVLTPEEMKDSLKVSDDVIYLNGVEEEKSSGWRFSTALQVMLGEDVYFDGYGLTGYLRGNLAVDKRPGTFMTGKGDLSLANGVFSVYGRTLDIVRSRVLFSGGPIDNPGVDVRAEKIVADKINRGDTIQVGVDVSGTADNLEFALFSDPSMDESDILSFMVVGRSMSEAGKQEESLLSSVAMALGLEKSVGIVDSLTSILPIDEVYLEGTSEEEVSLVVGKQLTDELYIGYDHNFFDQKGEVKVRYDLGSGFSAETRSSTDATGADLLYSFEK
jgi:translocation and assembly module TamB